MTPLDTVFIILVFSSYLKNPKQKYFIVLVPILAFTISFLSTYIPAAVVPYVQPIAAIVLCIMCLELAPLSLLLLFCDYNHFWDVLMIPFIWFVITGLMENLNSRINDEYLPNYIRGFPLRIISLGILYYIFYPLLLI